MFFGEALGVAIFEFGDVFGQNFFYIPVQTVADHGQVPDGVADVFPDSGGLVVVMVNGFFNTAGQVSGFSGDA